LCKKIFNIIGPKYKPIAEKFTLKTFYGLDLVDKFFLKTSGPPLQYLHSYFEGDGDVEADYDDLGGGQNRVDVQFVPTTLVVTR